MSAAELILLYVPMPLNAAGDGPADPDETVRVEHQLWDAETYTTVFTARDEASALQLVQAWNRRAPIKPSADTGELREEIARIIRDTIDCDYDGTVFGHNKAADAILDLIQSERAGSPIGHNDQPGLAFSGEGVKPLMTAQELAEHAQFAFENDLPDDFTPYDCAMAWRRVGEHLAAVMSERAEDGGMRDTNPSNQSIKEIAAALGAYAANTLKP